MEVMQLFGLQGSGSTSYLGESMDRAKGNTVLQRVWQPVLAKMLQYSCLENPLSDREAWQATVYRVARSWTLPKQPCVHRCLIFSACGSSAPVRVEQEGGAAA